MLRLGEDFDDVVVALPPAALAPVAGRLTARSDRWRVMLTGIETVATHAAQLWMRSTAEALGWRGGQTVLTGFAKPLDTWADLSHTLVHEGWSADDGPRSVAYLCAAMPDVGEAPGWGASPWPQQQRAKVRATLQEWLEHQAVHLWPGAVGAAGERGKMDESGSMVQGSGSGFSWDLLVAPAGAAGPDRLEHQFWRANVFPSDRYTLALPGTTELRLAPDDSGFDHLFLAGDWLRTGLNLGCVESAVMSGMQAARAIIGQPLAVVGERDLP